MELKKIHGLLFHSFKDVLTVSSEKIQKLKADDRIGSMGVSIYGNEEFSEAVNFDWVDTIQIPFNLLDNYSLKGELIKKGKKEVADPRLNVYWDKVTSKSFNYIPGSI